MEIENYDYVKSIIMSDFDTFSGKFLEKYFIETFKDSKQFNRIGSHWARTNQHEIDMIAVNDREKYAVIVEVKLSKKRIKLGELAWKAQPLVDKELSGYHLIYRGLSLDDMFSPCEVFMQ